MSTYMMDIHYAIILWHTLYHYACIITADFLMTGLQGSKHVEDTLWN